MELCHQLRLLFKSDQSNIISISDLHKIINDQLEKDYTEEQIIIGLDYARFKRTDKGYRIQVRTDLDS